MSELERDVIDDLCVICHAYGADKRTLHIGCCYVMKECAPEFVDNSGEYSMRICKSCRGEILDAMKQAIDTRRALREKPKDHDGYVYEEQEPERNIPVRYLGQTIMLTPEEYEDWKKEIEEKGR